MFYVVDIAEGAAIKGSKPVRTVYEKNIHSSDCLRLSAHKHYWTVDYWRLSSHAHDLFVSKEWC